jgi:hypothetical protein
MNDATPAMQPPAAQPFAAGIRPVASGRQRSSTSTGSRRRSRRSGRPAAGCTMDRPTGFPCRRSSPTLPHLRPRPAHCSASRWRRTPHEAGKPSTRCERDEGRSRSRTRSSTSRSTDRLARRAGESRIGGAVVADRRTVQRWGRYADGHRPLGAHHRATRTSASTPEGRRRPAPSTGIRRMAHGLARRLGYRHRRPDTEPADHRAWQWGAAAPGCGRALGAAVTGPRAVEAAQAFDPEGLLSERASMTTMDFSPRRSSSFRTASTFATSASVKQTIILTEVRVPLALS